MVCHAVRQSFLALLLWLPFMSVAVAQSSTYIQLLTSDSHQEYERVASTIVQALQPSRESPVKIRRLKVSEWEKGVAQPPPLLIAVGLPALRAVLERRLDQPLLALMVASESYAALLSEYESQFGVVPAGHISAVFMDQPVSHLVALAELIGGKRWQLGMVLGEQSHDLTAQALRLIAMGKHRLKLAQMTAKRDLVNVFRRELRRIDAVLVAYDPTVIDVNTTKQLLYLSYRQRMPVIAYSKAMVTAGAVVGVYSDAQAVSKHAIQLLQQVLEGGHYSQLPSASYSQFFDVSCNPTVARYLDIGIACDAELQQKLEAIVR